MVLEVLVSPRKVTGKPWEMFFIGAIYSLVGAGLGFWVFKSYASLVMVTFTAIAAVPFFHSAIYGDARQPEPIGETLLRKYGKIVQMFIFLFIGFVASFLLLYVLLPSGIVAGMFSAQGEAINAVRGGTLTGNFHWLGTFAKIMGNNLRILLFCLIISFFYGAGAIFILAWNASVMSTAIGNSIKEGLHLGTIPVLQTIGSGILGYFAHGIPEVVAYFMGALAGGIVSVAAMKGYFADKAFLHTAKDSLNLVAFALVVLFFAALIEIFISPGILR